MTAIFSDRANKLKIPYECDLGLSVKNVAINYDICMYTRCT